MSTLGELTKEQLTILAESEERAVTCAKEYSVGNDVWPEDKEAIEAAYCKGWFMGGEDTVKLIEQSTSDFAPFMFGMVVGAACAIMVLVAFQVIP